MPYTLTHVDPANRRDINAFLQLPFNIYRDIPQWVPPLMPGEKARFNNDYPFYEYGAAAFFLVRNAQGSPVGRVAVMENQTWNEYHAYQDALLYLYEAIDDDQVAKLLFDAAEHWATERDLNRLVGPKGFMAGDGLGLLVEGFEHRPAVGIPYNPAYYVRHWSEIAGMAKELDYVSAYIDREQFTYPERIRRIAAKLRKRRNFHVPTFTSKRELREQAPAIKEAYNEAFTDLWSYTPISDEGLEAIIDQLILIADPPLFKLIFKEDEMIGFQFAYPDISAAIQRTGGRIWPFGWIQLLWEKRRTPWLNVNGNAILPEYQGLGANAVLYDEMLSTLVDNEQYQYADLVQVQEDNARMLSDLNEIVPVNIYKRHRIYKKPVN